MTNKSFVLNYGLSYSEPMAATDSNKKQLFHQINFDTKLTHINYYDISYYKQRRQRLIACLKWLRKFMNSIFFIKTAVWHVGIIITIVMIYISVTICHYRNNTISSLPLRTSCKNCWGLVCTFIKLQVYLVRLNMLPVIRHSINLKTMNHQDWMTEDFYLPSLWSRKARDLESLIALEPSCGCALRYVFSYGTC